MRALYITLWPPTQSGIADYALTFASALELYGDCKVTVAPNPPEQSEKSFTLKDFAAVREQVIRWSASGFLRQFDLAHVELGSFAHRELFCAWQLKQRLPQFPVFATVHDPPRLVTETFKFLMPWSSSLLVRGGLEVVDRIWGAHWQKSFARRLQHVFVLSQRGAAALKERFGVKTTSLPFLASYSEAPEPRRLGDWGSPVVILFFGYLSPSKGLDILLRAFSRLVDLLAKEADAPPVELWINHTLEPEGLNANYIRGVARMANDIGPAVKRLGFVPEDRVGEVLSRADILALPYRPYVRRDRLSNSSTLVRGMLHGLAIVSSNFQVVDEEIVNGENGLLVEPGNVDHLAEQLHRLVKDPALRFRLGAAAREHVMREHSWPEVAHRVRTVYEEVLSGAR